MCATTKWRQCCSQWRFWVRPIIICLYAAFVLIVVPIMIVNSLKDGFTRNDQLILIGGLFVLTAIPMSVWHISQHIVHFTRPILQKHIIRILWMVPIYALNAWLGLIFPEHSIYMDSFRECYEAYVIYNFMVYLLNYLNLEMDLEQTLELHPPVPHFFPLCWMAPWEMGREFIHNCKHGILQYVVVRPLTTIISVICEVCGVYGESTYSTDVAFPYIMFVNNVSQFVAMYCLVLFYKANKTELNPMSPLPKFLCIKAVIFFSFFQGVIITILVYFEYIKDIFGSEVGNYKTLSSKLQDFLICVEMLLAAMAHAYSFPHTPFHINIPHYSSDRGWLDAFMAMWDISDVRQDVSDHFGVVGSSLSRRLRGRSAYHMARGTTPQHDSDDATSGGGAAALEQLSESEYLIQPAKSGAGYQRGESAGFSSGGSGYGAFDASCAPNRSTSVSTTKYDAGINIVKQSTSTKDYSPQYGAPKTVNYFRGAASSTPSISSNGGGGGGGEKSNSEHTTATTSTTTTTNNSGGDGAAAGTFTGLNTTAAAASGAVGILSMRKSDSTASDWLSTPTEEMLGIDVKGMEKDHIFYNA